MRRKKSGLKQTVRHWYHSRLAVVLESILIGIITGVVVALFRAALNWSDTARTALYQQILPSQAWYWTAFWAASLVIIGLFLGWAAKLKPMIRGSGIPQVKGALHRLMKMDWKPELPLKMICGILGLGAGLSLGREGPSIQIGAYIGRGVLSAFHRPGHERKYLIAAASAAGLSAAFNAPLAGVLFIQEELIAGFSPLLLACAMGASMASTAVSGLLLGMDPVFNFRYIEVLPLQDIPWIILLGLLCGVLGDCFKRALYAAQDFYTRCKIPEIIRPVLPLLVSVPLGFYLLPVLGGGHAMIESLSDINTGLGMIVTLLVVNLLFTAFCYGSGTAGGIFFPLLACGALTGAGFGITLHLCNIIVSGDPLNFLILGMAGFFTSVVCAPLTGIVLILEMSANFNHLGNLVLVSLTSFITVQILVSRPVYTVLLERMLGTQQGELKHAVKSTSPLG
jgi:H+/Cl- antiporter ClcA